MIRHNLSEWLSAWVLLAVLTVVVRAEAPAEQPAAPGIDYTRLRKDATELVFIHVDRVEVTDDGESVVEYQIEATVEAVERSARGLSKGRKFSFESYSVKPDAWRRGFVGPKSPKALYPGWTGWVFLDKSPRGEGLHPAAYGRSFEHHRDRAAPQVTQTPSVTEIEKLLAKLTELQIRTIRELTTRGYYSEALKETEVTAAESVEGSLILQKKDYQGWKKHHDKVLDRAIKRNDEVLRLPKK
jgi:hypothetical protein